MKNKGISLVELLVTISIIAIATIGVIRVSNVHLGWSVNKCSKLIDSALNKTMTQAMSKENVKGILLYQEDGVYYGTLISRSCRTGAGTYTLEDADIVERIELGRQPVTIKVILKETGGTNEKEIELTNQDSHTNMTGAAQFLYDKGSGAIYPVAIGGIDYSYTGIIVDCQGKTQELVIFPATGRHIFKQR